MLKRLIYIVLLSVSISGCIIVKEAEENETETPLRIKLSPKPELEMSDLFVRSVPGDMVAFIPRDWFFVNMEDKVSSEILAVAVNPDYTMCVVFAEIKKNEQIDEIVKKEGLIGLARFSYEKHLKKTTAKLRMLGNFRNLVLGNNSFVQFEMTATGGVTNSKTAVYQSNLSNYYEVSVFPMNITTKDLPNAKEIDQTFNSILATVKY